MSNQQVAFTADWHSGHKRILELCNRPFDSIEEHDAAIIERTNKKCPKGRLYILGDISPKMSYVVEILRQIKAEVHVVKGNHDPKKKPSPELLEVVATWSDYSELKHEDQHIVLSHYPFLSWNRMHYGSWMLHGHSHNNLAPTTLRRIDVGVDGHNFEPWTFEELRAEMTNRDHQRVDHH